MRKQSCIPLKFKNSVLGRAKKLQLGCLRKDLGNVLEVIYAAYASAGQGKKIELPFAPKVDRPIELWINPRVN